MRWSATCVLLAACSGSGSESPVPPASSASEAPIASHAPSAVAPSSLVAREPTSTPPAPSESAAPSAAAADAGTPSQVPCKTVADCWLDDGGHAIARPKALRGRPVPKGNCGENLLWLRNVLECKDGICSAKFIGDMC